MVLIGLAGWQAGVAGGLAGREGEGGRGEVGSGGCGVGVGVGGGGWVGGVGWGVGSGACLDPLLFFGMPPRWFSMDIKLALLPNVDSRLCGPPPPTHPSFPWDAVAHTVL